MASSSTPTRSTGATTWSSSRCRTRPMARWRDASVAGLVAEGGLLADLKNLCGGRDLLGAERRSAGRS